MLDGLIMMDERQRMVPVDPEELRRAVDRLLRAEASVSTLRHAGIGLFVLGEFTRAEQVLREALALAESAVAAADPKPVIAVRINLGDAYRYRGQLPPAGVQYREALQLARAASPDSVDFALQHLGKWHLDRGDPAAAESCLREALVLRQAKGDPELIRSTEATLRLVAQHGEVP